MMSEMALNPIIDISCLDDDLQVVAEALPSGTPMTNTLLLQLIRDVQRLTATVQAMREER